MPHQIIGEVATALLKDAFALAEEDHRSGAAVGLSKDAVADIELLFATKVQAYRQALLGCAIARVLDERIDIRYPATQRLANPKLEQLDRLIDGLLTVPSGGRIPAYLATGMFQTISDCHKLSWDVEFQGINAADKASGAVGDITIKNGGNIILGIEVTERAVSAARVKTTFDQKVAPAKLRDYLFVTTTRADPAAVEMARNYAAAGHEINFVDLKGWLIGNLASVGPECRAIFQDKVIVLLADAGTPAALRVAWNEKMDAAIGVRPG